jgi:hypothetical protein
VFDFHPVNTLFLASWSLTFRFSSVHDIASASKLPLDSRVVNLRVFNFRRLFGSLSEALAERSGELGWAVTESLAVFSKERLVYFVVL